MLDVTILLTLTLPVASPQGDDDLRAVAAAEARRTQVIAKVTPAVCAVMPMKAAGGGSGVIIDPQGFVLSNFHVVQRRQKKKKGGEDRGDTPDGPQHERDEHPKLEAIPLTPELLEKLKQGMTPERLKAYKLDGAKTVPLELLPRMRELWARDLDIVPPPRYAPEPADYDPDDPAWHTMKIGLPDGRLYPADVLGIDPGSDLAILKLRPRPDGKPYPYVELGDSDALLVGETVFAAGNPFLLATDFVPTITWGVVSGTHRYQPGGNNRFLVYPDCIQVDAPVNPGNSGGPLFNEAGQVVGINGRISVRDRGRVNVGVGFAIASNQIKNFLADMMAGRHTEHGTLDMNAWFMDAPGKEERRGVFVQSVFADAVVSKAGIRLGDEIVTFNGQQVKSANQLATFIGVLPAGSWVRVGFRSRNEDDTFSELEHAMIKMTALDTGSSRDPDRLATKRQRTAARIALTRQVGVGEEIVTGASLVLRGPKGEHVAYHRLGDKLRIELDRVVLVRTSDSDGFAVAGRAPRDLTAEERALLDRTMTSNPFLWTGTDRQRQVAETLLSGGEYVCGNPAYRFRVTGVVKQEVWLYADGKPAGWRLRDPVAKGVVEMRVAHDRGEARRVVDGGEIELGWKVMSKPGAVPDERIFVRPSR